MLYCILYCNVKKLYSFIGKLRKGSVKKRSNLLLNFRFGFKIEEPNGGNVKKPVFRPNRRPRQPQLQASTQPTYFWLKKVFYFGIGQSGKCHVNNVHQICVRKNQAHKCLLSFFWLFPAPFYVNLSFSHRKERRCCAWI